MKKLVYCYAVFGFVVLAALLALSGCDTISKVDTPSQQVYLAAVSYEPVQIVIEAVVLNEKTPGEVKRYLQAADKIITDGLERCLTGLESKTNSIVLACLSGVTRDIQQTIVYLTQKGFISKESF